MAVFNPMQQGAAAMIGGNPMFPGLSANQMTWLEKQAANAKDEQEKLRIMQDAYQKALPILKQKQDEQKVIATQNQLAYDKNQTQDPEQQKMMDMTLKTSQFAQAVKNIVGPNASGTDEEIINKVVNAIPNGGKLFTDYLNGGSEEILYTAGLKERPVASKGLMEQAAGGKGIPYMKPLISDWNKFSKENLGGFGQGMGMAPKVIANVIPSAWNIVAGLGNMILHPIDTAKGLAKGVVGAGQNLGIGIAQKLTGETKAEVESKIYNENNPVYTFIRDNLGLDLKQANDVGDVMGKFFVDRYGSVDGVQKAISEDPVGVIGDVVSVLEGGANLAGKVGLISESSKMAMLGRLAEVNPYTKLPELAVAGTSKVLGGIKKGLSNFTEAALNKITNIDAEDRAFAVANQDLVNGFIKGTKTVDDVAANLYTKLDDLTTNRASLGQEYEAIRAGQGVADTSAIIDSLTPELAAQKIVAAADGTLAFDKFSKFNAPQQKALNTARQIVNDAQSATVLDVDSILNLRQKLDDLINWEGKSLKSSAVDRETEALIKSFRATIDEQAKAIPGMAELDAKYGPAIQDLNSFKKDWFNTDGTLKDNALSKLKNLTNDANRNRLDRLETLFPGITQDIRGLKVGVAVDAATKSRVGQYAQQMLLGGGIMSAFANPAMLLPLVGAGIVLTPKNIIRMLQWGGNAEASINGIINKIKKGIRLTPSEEAQVAKIVDESKGQLDNLAQEINSKNPTPTTPVGAVGQATDITTKLDEWKKNPPVAAADAQKAVDSLTPEETSALYSEYEKANQARNPGSKAIIIDSDTIKKSMIGKEPKYHELSSSLSMKMYEEALKRDTSGIVKITGGGSASGKSEVVVKDIMGEPGVIFDYTLSNLKGFEKRYNMAKDAGKKVEIDVVYADQKFANKLNAIRTAKGNQLVPKEIVRQTHEGFRETVSQIAEKYPDVKVNVYVNRGMGKLPIKIHDKMVNRFIEQQRMVKPVTPVPGDEKITELISSLKENGGLTYSTQLDADIAGKPYISVGAYPMRGETVEASKLSNKLIADFIRKNKDVLSKKGHTLGAWINGEDGKLYLDISVVMPKKYADKAAKLGEKYNQISVFDLQDFKEIPTKGNGKKININENTVWDDVKNYL